MELSDLPAVLRRMWFVVLGFAIVGFIIGLVVEGAQPAEYVGEVTLYTSNEKADRITLSAATTLSMSRAESLAKIAGTEATGRYLVDELKLDKTPREVSRQITALAVKDTVMLQVMVQGDSEEEVRQIAEAIPGAYEVLIKQLLSMGPDDNTRVTLIDGPNVKPSRSMMNLFISSMFGLLLSLGLGSLVALLWTRLRRGINTPHMLRTLSGMPVLGIIPNQAEFDMTDVVPPVAQRGRWNGYHRLGVNLHMFRMSSAAPVVAVSSPSGGSGTTSTARGLAAALAMTGRQVLLVDTSNEGNQPFDEFGRLTPIASPEGQEIFAVLDRPDLFLTRWDIHLDQNMPGVSPALLAELLEDMRGKFDIAVLDLPPILTSVESSSLIVFADVVLMVAEQFRTTVDEVSAATQALHAMGCRRFGGVLNKVAAGSVSASRMLAGVSVEGDDTSGPKSTDMSVRS